MNETFKRTIFGLIYIALMWFGVSLSQITFHLLFFIILIMCLYEMWKLRKGKTKFLAFSYIIIPLIIIQLFGIYDTNLVLFMFILTWTFDTFAFIIGVKFGKNKINPSISPKKSWEGFIGGFTFTIIASYLSFNYFGFNSFQKPLIISITLPFTATLGDFIESRYKREANVKDSGNIIPGHGGILDRMDAFFITIPVLYILINLL